jgi:hypothetical protein
MRITISIIWSVFRSTADERPDTGRNHIHKHSQSAVPVVNTWIPFPKDTGDAHRCFHMNHCDVVFDQYFISSLCKRSGLSLVEGPTWFTPGGCKGPLYVIVKYYIMAAMA